MAGVSAGRAVAGKALTSFTGAKCPRFFRHDFLVPWLCRQLIAHAARQVVLGTMQANQDSGYSGPVRLLAVDTEPMESAEAIYQLLEPFAKVPVPSYFAVRRRLTDNYIQSFGSRAAALELAQADIARRIALSGSPLRAADELSREVADNLEALSRLSSRLLNEFEQVHAALQAEKP